MGLRGESAGNPQIGTKVSKPLIIKLNPIVSDNPLRDLEAAHDILHPLGRIIIATITYFTCPFSLGMGPMRSNPHVANA
ncbi:hypothetical protein WN943_010831 [Citrus x changshan-huyou]